MTIHLRCQVFLAFIVGIQGKDGLIVEEDLAVCRRACFLAAATAMVDVRPTDGHTDARWGNRMGALGHKTHYHDRVATTALVDTVTLVFSINFFWSAAT